MIRIALVGGSFVLARGATRLAVHEAVSAEPDVDDGLAEAAILFAHTICFGLFALGAAKFGGTGCGAHGVNLAPEPA